MNKNKFILILLSCIFCLSFSFSVEYCDKNTQLGEIIEDSYYCVQSGDSLSNIFNTYKNKIKFETVEEFGEENLVKNKDLIYVRQKLYLSPQPLISNLNPFSENNQKIIYAVKLGDSLVGIYNNIVVDYYDDLVSYSEFIQWNVKDGRVNLNNLDLIYPDDEIIVGVDKIPTSVEEETTSRKRVKEDIPSQISQFLNEFEYTNEYINNYFNYLKSKNDIDVTYGIANSTQTASSVFNSKLVEYNINQISDLYFIIIYKENEGTYFYYPQKSEMLETFYSHLIDLDKSFNESTRKELNELYEIDKLQLPKEETDMYKDLLVIEESFRQMRTKLDINKCDRFVADEIENTIISFKNSFNRQEVEFNIEEFETFKDETIVNFEKNCLKNEVNDEEDKDDLSPEKRELLENFESLTEESRCSEEYLKRIEKNIENLEDSSYLRSEIENDINICGTNRFNTEITYLKEQKEELDTIINKRGINDSQINECKDRISISKEFEFQEFIDEYYQKYNSKYWLSKTEFQHLIRTREYFDLFSDCILDI